MPLTRREALGAAAALAASRAVPAGASGRARPRPRRQRVPEPVAVLRTSWSTDPHARGSYSFLATGASSVDRRRLATPPGAGLRFAGEATSEQYAATAHGALLSGRHSATELLRTVRPGARVVVVGAGLAGLGAARELVAGGVAVTVLESRGAVGGRIRTDPAALGVPIDLGASWIHGVRGNPLVPLAAAAGARPRPFDYGAQARYTAAGRLSDGAEARLEARLQGALDAAGRRADELAGDVPLARLLPRPDALLADAVVTEIEHEYGAGIGELSGRHWNDGGALPGGDALITAGYGRIPAMLAAGLDIRLGHRADVVSWRDRVGVQGPWGAIAADHVIVTVPLGVLKARAIRFDPPLPAAHRRSIAALGSGVLDKLVLRFPRVFWDDELRVIDVAGRRRGLWAEWINLHPFTGAPVLMGFNAGPVARALAARPTGELVALALAALAPVARLT